MHGGPPREIRPIETRYKGYRFRSRLEARWAVFLDAIKVRWEYEKEGFDLDGRWYLPDFWIPYEGGEPGWGHWLEIKPTPLEGDQIGLLGDLARITGHRAYALAGQPWPGEHRVYVFSHHHHGEPESVPWISDGWIKEEFLPLYGYGNPLKNLKVESSKRTIGFVDGYDFMTSGVSLLDAFQAARSARFEHGESPHIPR